MDLLPTSLATTNSMDGVFVSAALFGANPEKREIFTEHPGPSPQDPGCHRAVPATQTSRGAAAIPEPSESPSEGRYRAEVSLSLRFGQHGGQLGAGDASVPSRSSFPTLLPDNLPLTELNWRRAAKGTLPVAPANRVPPRQNHQLE